MYRERRRRNPKRRRFLQPKLPSRLKKSNFPFRILTEIAECLLSELQLPLLNQMAFGDSRVIPANYSNEQLKVASIIFILISMNKIQSARGQGLYVQLIKVSGSLSDLETVLGFKI